MNIQKNVPLAPLTTFKLGGPASFFVSVKSIEELREAVHWAKENNQDIFILGGGSNTVVSDQGFDGLVIKIELKGIEFEERGAKVLCTAAAGEVWDRLVELTVSKGYYGLENLSSIPGTVGGAPVQNINAYGTDMQEVIEWVDAINIDTFEVRRFSNQDCTFDYDDSYFKTDQGKRFVILTVTFKLDLSGELNLSYRDLKEHFAATEPADLTLRDVREAVIKIRSKKFPDLAITGTAGSFFQNLVLSESEFQRLNALHPDMPYHKTEDCTYKMPVAWILDRILGFKGKRHKHVGCFDGHVQTLVNYGGGNASEVLELAKLMKQKFEEHTKLEIVPEVTIVGEVL